MSGKLRAAVTIGLAAAVAAGCSAASRHKALTIFFDGVARYWQTSVNFSNVNCLNASTFSSITFRPTQYPGTESKTISNVLRWGSGQPAARALMTGAW